jgi:hypothetical protein
MSLDMGEEKDTKDCFYPGMSGSIRCKIFSQKEVLCLIKWP